MPRVTHDVCRTAPAPPCETNTTINDQDTFSRDLELTDDIVIDADNADSVDHDSNTDSTIYQPRILPIADISAMQFHIAQDALFAHITHASHSALCDKIAGMIYGAAIGECLGLQVTGCTFDLLRETSRAVHTLTDVPVRGVDSYSWHNNTDQLLLVLLHVTRNGVFDAAQFNERFTDWVKNGSDALVQATQEYCSDATRGAAKNITDNNAIVRALPAAFLPQFTTVSLQCVSATHASTVAAYTAWASGYICRVLIRGEIPNVRFVVEQHKKYLCSKKFMAVYARVFLCEEQSDESPDEMLDRLLLDLTLDDQHGAKNVLKTLGCAIYALRALQQVERHATYMTHDSVFKEILINIVEQGGDCHTNACIAGAVLGSWLGYKKIPADWIYQLKHHAWLSEQIVQFLQRFN